MFVLFMFLFDVSFQTAHSATLLYFAETGSPARTTSLGIPPPVTTMGFARCAVAPVLRSTQEEMVRWRYCVSGIAQ